MGSPLDNILSSVGGGAGGALLGWLGMGINDNNQLNQNEALLQQQLQVNEQMATYNEGIQKDMWQYTNYPNQMKEIEAAGLNPALLYGKGGGGGATVGIGSGGVQATAPIQQNIGQMAMQGVQTAQNQEAINNQQKVQDAQAQNLIEQTGNTRADTVIKNANGRLAEIAADVADQTKDARIKSIEQESENLDNLGHSLRAAGIVDEELIKTRIQQGKQSLANSYIQGELMEKQGKLADSNVAVNSSQIALNKSEISKNSAIIAKTFNDMLNNNEWVAQGWANVGINNMNAMSNGLSAGAAFRNSLTQEHRLEFDQKMHNLDDLTGKGIDVLMGLFGGTMGAIGKAIQ